MRLVNNRLARQIESNETLRQYVKEHGVSWQNESIFVKKVLELILTSDFYQDYVTNPVDTYETDREFWRLTFRKLICGNKELEDDLEDISIYWNDDVDIIETFILKTIKQFNESAGSQQPLLPMYKDRDAAEFGIKLFRFAIKNGNEYRKRINTHIKHWEMERLATMDMIIMQVAIAEIINFPDIPIKVTLNEYIDAAKYYSTPKSGFFINGILDTIVLELKNEKILWKD